MVFVAHVKTCSVFSAPYARILPCNVILIFEFPVVTHCFRLRRQMFLKSVSSVFQTAVDAEEQLIETYLRFNQPRFDPEAIPARKRYLNRRVKLVQTLLRWRKHSGQSSGVESLVKRAVDVFIVPVADGGWDVGGEECLRKVRLRTLL